MKVLFFVSFCFLTLSLIIASPEGLNVLEDDLRMLLEKEFCWRDSYGRGVGTIPQSCSADRDRIGLLCYTKCPAGMHRAGFDCHSNCPDGWRDDGLFCRNAEYGRGAGYPWKFGDPFNDSGQWRRCEKDNGKGNCEKNGLILYPKCKPGFNAFGCCICRPQVPNCASYNLNAGIDLSCGKKIKIGDPVTGTCSPDQDKNVGLCYPKCSAGYHGVGPVCWGTAPDGWVECGMGAAKDVSTCAKTIINQVVSVGSLALNIATLGTSGEATAAANAGGKLAKMKEMFSGIKKIYDANKEVFDTIKAGGQVVSKAKTAYDSMSKIAAASNDDQATAEDFARYAAELASVIDPTGVSGVVAAYTYPKCSKYFPAN